MDVLENILERISQIQEERDGYLRQAEAEEQKITKLESMYYLLEDPATQELMHDVVVGMAVQNGVPVANGNQGNGAEKHYVGMQRVREYVAAMPAAQFTVHDVFVKSIEHLHSPKSRHPEFEKQRKASISLALMSMAKAGALEVVKQGRGREVTVYRKQEGK